MPAATMQALADMGHDVVSVSGYERSLFGRGHIIIRDKETAVLTGGSDPRGDGCAMSFDANFIARSITLQYQSNPYNWKQIEQSEHSQTYKRRILNANVVILKHA